MTYTHTITNDLRWKFAACQYYYASEVYKTYVLPPYRDVGAGQNFCVNDCRIRPHRIENEAPNRVIISALDFEQHIKLPEQWVYFYHFGTFA